MTRPPVAGDVAGREIGADAARVNKRDIRPAVVAHDVGEEAAERRLLVVAAGQPFGGAPDDLVDLRVSRPVGGELGRHHRVWFELIAGNDQQPAVVAHEFARFRIDDHLEIAETRALAIGLAAKRSVVENRPVLLSEILDPNQTKKI